AARRARAAERGEYRHPRRARAADQDRAGRAGLFLSLRIQHGLDAAGALRARRAFRENWAAAAIDREREGAGPGCVHVRPPASARQALDGVAAPPLARTAPGQIRRRKGHFPPFMCRPALAGYYSSGWHLHQSLVDGKSGRNLFTPEREGEYLSPQGRAFLGGLMTYAAPSTVFATPTVNGYRRLRPNPPH